MWVKEKEEKNKNKKGEKEKGKKKKEKGQLDLSEVFHSVFANEYQSDRSLDHRSNISHSQSSVFPVIEEAGTTRANNKPLSSSLWDDYLGKGSRNKD